MRIVHGNLHLNATRHVSKNSFIVLKNTSNTNVKHANVSKDLGCFYLFIYLFIIQKKKEKNEEK